MVIKLTRLSGDVLVINADLIERVEPTPDSVITLTNGSCFVVRESVEEVVELARRYKSEIYRGVFYPANEGLEAHPHLHIYESPKSEV